VAASLLRGATEGAFMIVGYAVCDCLEGACVERNSDATIAIQLLTYAEALREGRT